MLTDAERWVIAGDRSGRPGAHLLRFCAFLRPSSILRSFQELPGSHGSTVIAGLS